MNNVYECSTDPKGRPTIIIRRKPSEIPWRIEQLLLHAAGMSQMDGPNNRVEYVFLLPEKFAGAEASLVACGWTKKDVSDV